MTNQKYLLKYIRVRHLHLATVADLIILAANSPHQTVRKYAAWKLSNLNQN